MMTDNERQTYFQSYFSFKGITPSDREFTKAIDLSHWYIDTEEAVISPYILAGGNLWIRKQTTLRLAAKPVYTLLYLYDGMIRVSFDADGSTRTLQNGHLLFLGPDTAVSFDCRSKEIHCFLCFLQGEVLSTYIKKIRNHWLNESFGYYHMQFSSEQLELRIHHISDLLSHTDENRFFYISRYLIDLFTDCIYTNQEELNRLPSRLAHSLKEILDQSYEKPHTLDELSEQLHVNKYRLCREFARCFGDSPMQYLNRKRLETAAELLCLSSRTVRDIGEAVGIPNTTHFIRLFKRTYGITPLQFRELHDPLRL